MLYLIVLLGCHINYIMDDRINTAIVVISSLQNENTNIEWFLSGGIKDKSISIISEADKMESHLLNCYKMLP